MNPSKKFRVAHIGDLHFWHIPWNPFLLINKRILGMGNLIVGGRARRFRQEFAPQLADRIQTSTFDTHLFSGDFSTTSLSHEFDKAHRTFSSLKESHAVPGNHDCYITTELDGRSFSRGLQHPFQPETGISLVEISPSIGLIRINATTSNGMAAHGRISPHHLEFLESKRSELNSFSQLVLLCHFPPEDPPGVLKHDRGPQLLNARPLLDLIASIGKPTLWLHGHHHYRWIYGSPTVPNLTYLNGGAPLMRFEGKQPDLGFHEVIFGDSEPLILTHFSNVTSGEWQTVETELPGDGRFIDLQRLKK